MKRFAAIGLGLAMVLAGCSGAAEEPTPEETTTEEPTTETPTPEPTTEEPTTEEPPEPVLWPLLGVEQPNSPDEAVVNPVVGVKVENSSAARPWRGLVEADLVFVELVEAGMTRFHAVYNSELPDVIGPVRSLRPMDAAILGQWNATLVASGGQPQFVSRVRGAVKTLVTEGHGALYRERGRRAPHNMMLNTQTLLGGLETPEAVSPLAEYGDPSSAANGTAVSGLTVTYPGAKSSWEWNATDNVWMRSDNGRSSVDTDGNRVYATNVLVLSVTTRNTGAYDPAGSPVPETILNGSGSLTFFAGGKSVEGTWEKGGDMDPFILKDAEGNPLLLSPGKTWIELMPQNSSLRVTEATD